MTILTQKSSTLGSNPLSSMQINIRAVDTVSSTIIAT